MNKILFWVYFPAEVVIQLNLGNIHLRERLNSYPTFWFDKHNVPNYCYYFNSMNNEVLEFCVKDEPELYASIKCGGIKNVKNMSDSKGQCQIVVDFAP